VGLEPTEPLRAALPGVVAAVVAELDGMGVVLRRRRDLSGRR